jgi:hypothetical protein
VTDSEVELEARIDAERVAGREVDVVVWIDVGPATGYVRMRRRAVVVREDGAPDGSGR